jgi:putative endopeptidase
MNDPIDPQDFDHSIKPTDDFFCFVNQKWIDKNPIPPEESRWGSFYSLRVDIERQIQEILDALNDKPDPLVAGRAKKVRDFYRTGMDMPKRNELGDAPLADLFADIDSINGSSALSRVLGTLHRNGVDAWWSCQVDADAKQSDVVALYLGQGGIGLPDRDYYLKDDAKSGEIREKYVSYMRNLLAGSPSVRGTVEPQAAVIIDLETKLAGASMTRVELRDIEKQYHKFSPEKLAELAPQIDWPGYFEAIGIPAVKEVIVCQPDFIALTGKLFAELPLDIHRSYLRWCVLNDLSHCLDESRERQRFDFYGRTFSGTNEMKSLPRRVQRIVSALLDEAVAELYVEAHFSEQAKKKIGELVDHLSAAYRARISKLDWMSEETKKKTIAKLAAVSRKLGYPDVWKDIEKMEIGNDSYAANIMCAHRFEFDRKMKQVGGPVDRSEWYMSPQTVNACYEPLRNEILFPAAILQPPFFDPDADDAVNFGGIGTTIGHELTHGFDDQGALFDAQGNLANWWTKEDKVRFDAQTERLAKQFDKFEALPGLFVNGQLTLGENIADLGGLLIAYDGLMLSLEEKGTGSEKIGGLLPAERFFVSYAISERGAVREEALRFQTQIDPHSPSRFRVNGPLSNMQEFFEAFSVKPGDKLWRDPEDRVNIW